MKRIFSLLFACLFCVLTFVGCANEGESDVPAGMARVKNSALSLWLFYPETWTVAENGEFLKLVSQEQNSLEGQMSASDVTDGGAVLPSNIGNVALYRIQEDVQDLKAYAEGKWREGFSSRFVFDPAVEERLLGSDETYTVKYHFAAESGEALYRFSQTLILHDGAVYALVFTATPELFDILEDSFRDISKSVTFEEVPQEENSPLSTPADPTVAEDAERIPQKEGLVPLTNKGVEFILYYPQNDVWQVEVDSGFLALKAECGATVSVVRGDAYAARIQTPEDYLDRQYYPMFDALYAGHTETARKSETRDDGVYLLRAEFDAVIEGEDFSFVQVLYMKHGYIYTLLFTAKSADYASLLADVDAMIASFEIKA